MCTWDCELRRWSLKKKLALKLLVLERASGLVCKVRLLVCEPI